MSDGPVHGPEIEVEWNILLAFDLHPVLPETIRKYTSSTLRIPGASYAPPAEICWLDL